METFPFGEPVIKVEQEDKSPKKVFILGVYASAVHARWISNEGKTIIHALAVASEPEIFWKGDDAEEIINKIKLPSDAGKLIPANKNLNGPSGKVLDTEYLYPLGITRKDSWLCDLVPYSLLNKKQEAAINRNDKLFTKYNLKKPTMSLATKTMWEIDGTRKKEIANEIKKSKAEYLITLGNEPLINFVKVYNPDTKPLNLKEKYSVVRDINIDSYPIKLIPLVHPRQAGKLGRYSVKWYKTHELWKTTTAKQIKKILAANSQH